MDWFWTSFSCPYLDAATLSCVVLLPYHFQTLLGGVFPISEYTLYICCPVDLSDNAEIRLWAPLCPVAIDVSSSVSGAVFLLDWGCGCLSPGVASLGELFNEEFESSSCIPYSADDGGLHDVSSLEPSATVGNEATVNCNMASVQPHPNRQYVAAHILV